MPKLAFVLLLACLLMSFNKPPKASATINRQINFQGKIVLNSNSANITNGTYNMEFKIYSGGDGVLGGGDETLLWTEDHLRNASQGVTITDGIFQVNLGAITSLPGSIDFNNSTLWLSMNLGSTNATCTPFSSCTGDGEMTPFVRFTAAPYALNSDLLDGLDSTAFSQLSGANTWGGTNTFNSQSTFNTDVDYVFSGTENIAVTSDLAGTVNVLSVVATPSSTAGTTSGLFVQQANSANTNGLDNGLTIDNADTDLPITAALKIQNSGGGGYTTIIDDQGTLISAAELNLLDGRDTALVDTTDAVATAITGTGALNAGSITSGFGAIDTGADNITTTGTIGTAGVTTFTGGAGTFTGDLSVSGATTLQPSADDPNGFQVATTTGSAIINVSTASTKNLLVDGNFEGTAVVSNWAALNGATLSSVNTSHQFGSRALQAVLVAANASDGVKYIYPFKPNTTYALSVYAAITSGSTATYEMGTVQNGGSQTSCGVTGVTLTASLTRYTCTFTTGSTLLSTDFFYFKRTTAAAGTLVFDGAQLEQASAVTTYADPGLSLTNLIAYPSFENSNTNGWSVHGTGTGASIAASTDYAKYGNYSLKVVTGTTASGAEYRQPFSPNTQYSLTFWAKLSSGTSASGEFTVGHNDNPGSLGTATGDTVCTTTPDITLTSAVTTTWTQYTCSFTTGATIGASSNFFIKQTDTTTSTLYVDAITLVQASTGLTFTPLSNGLDINNYTSNIVLNGNGSGELQPWKVNNMPIGATSATDTTNRVTNHEGAASTNANGYLYVLGGYDGTNVLNSVTYAKLNADGSVGAWSCQGTAVAASCGTSSTPVNANNLPTARRLLATTIANGYIYAVGGFDGSNSASTVYYAKLNGDGSTGTWQTNAYAIGQAVAGTAQPRVAPSIHVANGFMYVLGGCSDAAASTCATPQSTIYYGKVFADGSIGPWTTNANALTAARGMGTVATANGYMYYIGGASNATTVNTNVYCAQINSDGSVASFATTTCTALPAARAQQATVIANGYMYVIGGCSVLAASSCTTATSTVWYSSLNGDGTNGQWYTASNSLPANRGAAGYTLANSYIYMLGGYDASARQATIYYASTPRVFVSGGLDLVGLSAQSAGDAGGGGTLTAGNTSIVGNLRVDGYVDINNGLTVDSAINLNAISATAGQTIFNINNSNTNSIFNIRHMSTEFGGLATTGAFMSKNAYWGDEFGTGKNSNVAMTGSATAYTCSWGRGDNGGNLVATNAPCTATGDVNSGAGEMSVGVNHGAAADSCAPTQTTGANSVQNIERITETATTGTHTAVCSEWLTGGTGSPNTGVMANIIAAGNKPIIEYKVKASSLAANSANNMVFVGLYGQGATADAPSTIPGTAASTGGVYFTNCTASTPTCGNTQWNGWVVNASGTLIGNVACTNSGALSTTNFAYLRIEFTSATEVHFYADSNVADGIKEVECGTGVSSASVPSLAMTPYVSARTTAASAAAGLDIDYIRAWWDDNVVLPNSDQTTQPADDTVVSTPPLTTDTPVDTSTPTDDTPIPTGLFDFLAATNEDTTFNNDVYVKGTLFADKIKANQIEGLELLTDKVSSLSAKLAADQVTPATPTSTATPTANQGVSIAQLGTVTMQNASVTLNLDVGGTLLAGGLTLNGPAEFNADSIFNKLVTFVDDTAFQGRATFNNDSGGFAVIYPGQQQVQVKFAKEYKDTPIVTANIVSGQFAPYSIISLDTKGFTLLLKDPADSETHFAWTALSIKDAQTTELVPPPNQN